MKHSLRRLPLLLAGTVFAVGAARGETPLATGLGVQEVLARHAQALGGLENLRSLMAVKSEGEVSAGGLKGTFVGYQLLPDRTRNELDLKVVRQVQVNNHGAVWIQDANGQVRDARGDELRGFVSEACVSAYRYLLGSPDEVKTTMSSEPSDSTQYVTLRVEPRGGEPVRLALDPTTWLPRKFVLESAAWPRLD